jgi:hypothetical protein
LEFLDSKVTLKTWVKSKAVHLFYSCEGRRVEEAQIN